MNKRTQIPWQGNLVFLILAVLIPSCAGFSNFNPKDLPPELKWVSIEEIPIVYRDHGNVKGKKEIILLFCPYPFSTELYSDFVRYLTPRARVIVVEPPGLRAPRAMKGDFSTFHLLHIFRQFVVARVSPFIASLA